MKTGKESSGKAGFSQSGEQILPLIAAEEMHALKGLLHVLTHEAATLLFQNCCCFVQRSWFAVILISCCLMFFGMN